MGTITLDDRDEAILAHLHQGEADVDSIAESVDCGRDYLRDRLPELADNGLVLRVRDDVYEITANGERTITASPAGELDERIDTPPEVNQRIASFDLRPDKEEAVRNAFGFLQYWGTATEGEIIDAVYSENPVGFDESEEWWDECISDLLADLPLVDAAGSDEQEWEFTETAMVDQSAIDGRDTAEDDAPTETSARYALERSDIDEDERTAVRAAFDVLVQEGDANAAELKQRIYPDHDAGYESPDAWWSDCVQETLESLPGVEQTNESRGLWEYDESTGDPASADGGPGVRDGPHGR